LVVARRLRVDDRPAKRKHGLRPAVAPLLGRASRRVAFHQEELPKLGLALRAVGELRREPLVVHALLPRQLARLARRLTGLRRAHALVDDLARGRRVLLEGFGELVVHVLLDETFDVAVSVLGLRLILYLLLL